MPCMCGNIYCMSCGPAQGNYKCPHCGRWTFDGGCAQPIVCEATEAESCMAAERDYLIDCYLEQEAKRQGVVVWAIDLDSKVWDSLKCMDMGDLRRKVGK